MNIEDMAPCGDSVKVAQLPFQEAGGAAVATSPLQIKSFRVHPCAFKDIRHIFEGFHYKGGHMGGGISFCMAVWSDGRIVGGAVIGNPRHMKKYEGALEIRRLAMLDAAPTNSESWFLGQILRYMKKNTKATYALSYADRSVGHKGTIYKAANFKHVGDTSPSKHVFWNGVRYHPRSLTIDRPYSYALREAVKTGEAVVETGEAKAIYVFNLSPKQG